MKLEYTMLLIGAIPLGVSFLSSDICLNTGLWGFAVASFVWSLFLQLTALTENIKEGRK